MRAVLPVSLERYAPRRSTGSVLGLLTPRERSFVLKQRVIETMSGFVFPFQSSSWNQTYLDLCHGDTGQMAIHYGKVAVGNSLGNSFLNPFFAGLSGKAGPSPPEPNCPARCLTRRLCWRRPLRALSLSSVWPHGLDPFLGGAGAGVVHLKHEAAARMGMLGRPASGAVGSLCRRAFGRIRRPPGSLFCY
eukprot:SAG31_NODE_4161_length_3522_cov_1.727432_3_plen_190_part_00